MNLDKMLRTEPTGNVYEERKSLPYASYKVQSSKIPEPQLFNESEEYSLHLTIGINFVANKVQYDRAKARAERHLKYSLYSDIVGDLLAIGSKTDDWDIKKDIDTLINKLVEGEQR